MTRMRTALKWTPTMLPLIGSMAFLWIMYTLRRDYPELRDNTPGLYGDSPRMEHFMGIDYFISTYLAVFCLGVSAIVALATVALSRPGTSPESQGRNKEARQTAL